MAANFVKKNEMQIITNNGYRENMLSRFKFFGPTHHFQKSIYRNKGVRKDAERFSLVDPVLDGEYNDPETMWMLELSYPTKMRVSGASAGRVQRLKARAGRLLFQTLLFTRFCTYFVLHLRYRP